MALKLTTPAAAATNLTNETLLHHIRVCSDASAAVAEAQAVLKKRFQTAKDDGCNRRELARALRDRDRDPDKVVADLRDRVRILALLNVPVHQTELFGAPVDTSVGEAASAEHLAWQAEAAGYASGTAGGDRTRDNPHQAGTELYAAHDSGWLRGQAKIGAGMRKAARTASTRRKRSNGEDRAAGFEM